MLLKRIRAESAGDRDEIMVLRIDEILKRRREPTIGLVPKREKRWLLCCGDGDDEVLMMPKRSKRRRPGAVC